jgi:hypothetical protein
VASRNISIARQNASSLRKIFFSFLFTDFDLLFLAATAELIRLELVLGLELGPAMLWDVPVRHGC